MAGATPPPVHGGRGSSGGHELDHEPGGVADDQRALGEARRAILGREARRGEPVTPGVERAHRHRERRRGDLSRAVLADRDAPSVVREGGPDRPGRARLGRVVEVVDVMVVEIDGAFDEVEAEQSLAEIKVGLGLIHGGGHVMQA